MSRWDALYLMYLAGFFVPVLLGLLGYALRWWRHEEDWWRDDGKGQHP